MSRKEYNVQVNFIGNDKLSAAALNVKKALKGLAIGIAGVTTATAGMVYTLDKLAGRGGKVIKLRDDFAKLTKTIHSTSGESMEKLRKATKGMIDDFTLMSRSAKMLQMGLVTSDEQMANSIKYAIRFGDATMDTTEKIDSYIAMIKNSNLMLVDNFGLTRGLVSQRMELLEATKGLTREEAFSQAVSELLGEKMAKLGDSTETASDGFSRLKARLVNLKDEVLVRLEPLFGKIADKIDDWSARLPELQAHMARLRDKIQPVIDTLVELGRLVYAEVKPVFDSLVYTFKTEVLPAYEELKKENQKLYATFSELMGGEDGMRVFAKLLSGVIIGAMIAFVYGLKLSIKYAQWYTGVMNQVTGAVKAYLDAVNAVKNAVKNFTFGAWDKLIGKVKTLWYWVQKVADKIGNLNIGGKVSGMISKLTHRQLGGAVRYPMLVGERGPEVITGNRVIPHATTDNRQQTIVNNFYNTEVSPDLVSSRIAFQLSSL